MKNIMGDDLKPCSLDPMTGYYRDGCCKTGPGDMGVHTVCVVMTDEFLAFSKSRGNDLSTAKPQWQFPGLKAGDRWCLCAPRWQEAYEAGFAPKVLAEATHIASLEHCDGKALRENAVDL